MVRQTACHGGTERICSWRNCASYHTRSVGCVLRTFTITELWVCHWLRSNFLRPHRVSRAPSGRHSCILAGPIPIFVAHTDCPAFGPNILDPRFPLFQDCFIAHCFMRRKGCPHLDLCRFFLKVLKHV